MDVLNEVNKLNFDEFGRPNGIILVDKPVGKSAHDIVDEYRKKLGTRKVGHAGALDIFAKGLLIILVGKSTKHSDLLLNLDKTYEARLLLGVATDTQDTEGKITEVKKIGRYSNKEIDSVLKSFIGEYEQFVSVYSSVKVDGQKLRKVMRDDRFRTEIVLREGKKFIRLLNRETGNETEERQFIVKEIEVPKRKIRISGMKLFNAGEIKGSEIKHSNRDDFDIEEETFQYIDFEVRCSKGTYIRQLAEDIGSKFNCPASLIELNRTGIDKFTLKDVFKGV